MGVEVHVNRFDELAAPAADDALAERAVRAVLEEEGRPAEGELSVTCLEAGEIADMNLRYLGREGPTDVIAFELGEGEWLLGDVYVCPPVARRSARDRNVPVREELLRLVVHGVLHVLGHEHPEGGEEERAGSEMFRRQEELLRRVLAEEE